MGALGSSKQSQQGRDETVADRGRRALLLLLGAGLGSALGGLLLWHVCGCLVLLISIEVSEIRRRPLRPVINQERQIWMVVVEGGGGRDLW